MIKIKNFGESCSNARVYVEETKIEKRNKNRKTKIEKVVPNRLQEK
jgi:hypothetical protein